MAKLALAFDILGRDKDASSTLDKVGDSADRAGGKLSGLGTHFASLAKAAALGFAGATIAAGAFAKSAIDAGSDLNETISKSNTVFGSAAGSIDQWSRTAAASFGQSRKQALEAASSFGNMFSQLGIGDEQAASMSKSMTELASDFASFHNADISEVLAAQEAAFRGEYDSVQRFVPTINAAAVEQKALEMGLGKTNKELDAQDKALATQALLLEGAGDAAGDFARTSDGLANKQRIMSARFDDVKAKIGQGLMPVAVALAGFFSDKLLPAFEEVGGGIMAFVGAFQHAEDGVTSSGFPGFMERLAIAVRGVFDDLSAKVEEWGPVITDALVGFGAAILGWWETHGPAITEAVTGFAEDFGTYVLEPMATVAAFVVEELVPKVATFVTWIAENQAALEAFGILIGITLVGHYVKLATEATISATKQVAAWVSTKTAAIASAAQTAAIVALYIAGWASMAAKAVLHAAAIVASWVATTVAGAGSTTAHGVFVASQTVGWAALARAAAVNAASIARSWAAALGPVAAVVAAAETINELTGRKLNPNNLSLLERLDPRKAFEGLDFGFDLPWGDDGGVMPGPRGVHRLAWVAGGETLIPTHKAGVRLGGDEIHLHVTQLPGEDQVGAGLRALRHHKAVKLAVTL